MEIEGDTQPRFVDVEEVSQPREEELDHARVAVRERHGSIGLSAFAGIEGNTCDEELTLAQGAHALEPFGTKPFDLLRACDRLRMWPPSASAAVPVLPRASRPHGLVNLHVATPKTHARLRNSELGTNLVVGPALGS